MPADAKIDICRAARINSSDKQRLLSILGMSDEEIHPALFWQLVGQGKIGWFAAAPNGVQMPGQSLRWLQGF